MEIRYLKHYSSHLYREMEIKIYGHAGKPVLFIPCQGGRFFDFENFQMLDHWAHWIEEGRFTVYSIDTIDNETYANKAGDCRRGGCGKSGVEVTSVIKPYDRIRRIQQLS